MSCLRNFASNSIILCMTLALAAPALADEAQNIFAQAKAYSLDGPQYQYDIEIGIKDMSTSGTVNPAAAPGERVSLHAPEEQLPQKLLAEVEEYDSKASDSLWCQSLLDEVEDYSKARREGDRYIFDLVLRADEQSKEEKKFAQHVDSTVTVSAEDGAVLQYTMRAPKPFRPVLVAKIKQFDLAIDCKRAPDGRTYAHRMRIDIAGRAMMKSFEESQRRVVSNLVALP